MARMYPPNLVPDDTTGGVDSPVASRAERSVWHALREQLDDEWVVIHSLWHRTHANKLDAEADFVLIGPPGLLVFEVKGGLVERDADGRWLFSSLDGHLRGSKREGPFAQARGAMYGLRRHLERIGEERLYHDHVWGYGVIMPECALRVPVDDPEIADWMLLGELGYPEGLSEFVETLLEHWREARISKGYRHETLRPISPHVAEKLLLLFRPAIGYVAGLGVEAQRVERQLVRLTTEQKRVLDLLSSEERVILRGSAGTGKTIIAVEQARRQAVRGRRVLFVCFNRNLADMLRAVAADDEELWNVQFHNYHQLLGRLLARADVHQAVPEDWASFNAVAEELVVQALDADSDWRPFDALIIDEAQDLMASEFMDVLGLLLKDGLRTGSWTICLDPTQALFEDQFDEACAEHIGSLGVSANLTVNCRNTRSINAYVYGLGQLEMAASARVDGPHPTIEYYRDRSEFKRLVRGTINRIVRDFREVGLDESEIVVLLARTGEPLDDLVAEQRRIIAPVVRFSTSSAEREKGVSWATVQSFKGLEAKAVILTGLESLRDSIDRRLFYVGASRAHSILAVLLPQYEEESVQLSMTEVMNLLSRSAE